MKKTAYQIVYEIIIGGIYFTGTLFIAFKAAVWCESILKGSGNYVSFFVYCVAIWAIYAYEKNENKKD